MEIHTITRQQKSSNEMGKQDFQEKLSDDYTQFPGSICALRLHL